VGTKARALAKSLESAAEGLETPCERSYAITLALSHASKRRAPNPADYREVCEALPEEMQLCLSPAYQMDHFDECVATREALDPDLLRRLQEVMGGRPQ
jgi:hypothetical protein